MKFSSMNRRATSPAFTLIELLVVVSIISLLASIIFASGAYARARAADAAQLQTAHTIQTAIAAHIAEHGYPPPNYNSNGPCSYGPNCNTVAYSDEEPSLWVEVEGQDPVLMNRYQASMNDLVIAGYLSEIPESANRRSALGYFNFGTQSELGAVVFAALPTHPDTEDGESGTCRFDPDSEGLQVRAQGNASLAYFSPFVWKSAKASSFFFNGPYQLGPVTADYELTWEGSLNSDYPGFTLRQRVSGQNVNPNAQSQSLSQQNENQDGGDSGNSFLNFDEVVQPTCSSVEPNSSYCLCSTY